MRKTKKIKATYDAIGSLDPTEAGEILSTALGGNHDLNFDWKNHEFDPSSIYIGDSPSTSGSGGISINGHSYGPTIINPTISGIGGISGGTFTTAIDVSELEGRIKKLEEIVVMLQVELDAVKKRGGFWRRPNI